MMAWPLTGQRGPRVLLTKTILSIREALGIRQMTVGGVPCYNFMEKQLIIAFMENSLYMNLELLVAIIC